MSAHIPLMHSLTPPVAATAVWHVYKLKTLENGGGKKQQWLLQGDEGVAAF